MTREWIVALVVVAIAGAVFLSRVPSFPLLGFDSYPEILTSRILDFSDFVETFSEQTSEGFHPSAFYRPIFNLSLALDFALWGIEPLGYHLTTILLVCACGLATFWLCGILLGPGPRWGPWATLVFYLLLPVHAEIIPLVSRRMDVLCGLFSLLALATQVLRIRRPAPIAGLVPAVLTGLAVGSKEAGVAVVPLVFLLAITLRADTRPSERLRFAGRVAVHHLAAVAFVFTARLAAIGGLGGHPLTDPSALLIRLPTSLGSTVLQITSAWPVAQLGITAGSLHAISAITLGLLMGILLLLLRRGRRVRSEQPVRRTWEVRSELTSILIGGTWIVVLAGIYAVTGPLRPWYLFLPSIGLTLVLGAVVQILARRFRENSGVARHGALVGLIAIALWIGMISRFSPLMIGFGHWDVGAQRVGRYLELLTRQVDATPDGGYFEVRRPPQMGRGNPSPITTRIATWISIYSLPAWAELRFPGRSIQFRELPLEEFARDPESEILLIGIRGS